MHRVCQSLRVEAPAGANVDELAPEAPEAWRRPRVTEEAVVALIRSKSMDQDVNMENFPESLYGAGMCFLVQCAATTNRAVHALAFLIGLALVLNILLQIYVVWNVKMYVSLPAVEGVQELYAEFQNATYDADRIVQMDAFRAWEKDKQAKLCQLPLSKPRFTMIILGTWTLCLVIEIKETILFAVWWLQLPNVDKAHHCVEFIRLDEGATVIVRAASRGMKTAVVAIILLPKLVITMFLWWVGARWLISTPSFEGLLLNCVALAFVVEFDEMLFQAIVPHRAKKTMEGYHIEVPPAQGDTDRKVVKWILQMGGTCLFLIMAPMLYMHKFQCVLPNYRFDVHDPCEWLHEKMDL